MSFNLTWHLGASQSNLTRLWAGDFGWLHSEIAALEKRAGRAGNRYGCDLGVRLTNLNRRTNHELKSR
jgi:hypothetical protein